MTTVEFPLFNTDGSSTKPLGFPMNQNRLAVPTWSYAMEIYPPARIIELGSYNGGFITALALHAWHINCACFSYDRMVAPDENFKALSRSLGVAFRTANIFEPAIVSDIKELIQRVGVTYLLCDNGDKPREFNLFAPFLKSGDVIAAHDFGATDAWPWQEIQAFDTIDAALKYNLERWMIPAFTNAGWLVYKKS